VAGVNQERDCVRRDGRDLFFVLLLAIALRSVVMAGAMTLPLWSLPEVDAAIFHESARRIAQGDLLLGHDVLRMSPGYFYFLGGIYSWFGDGPLAFRLVQLALGLFTIALIWDSAHHLFGRRVALAIGLALAWYEPLAFYENLPLGETLATSLLSILVWWCIRKAEGPGTLRLVHIAGMGALFGLLCSLRPNALALVFPLLWFVWRRSELSPIARRFARCLCLVACAALALTPIAARNYIATSEWAPTGHLAGINLYLGNAKGATGSFRAPAEVPDAQGPERQFAAFRSAAERAEGRPLTAKEVDRYWQTRTVESVLEDPWAWLSLMFKKTRLFFNGRELSDVYNYGFLREYSPWLGIPALQFQALAPFALLGVLVLLTQKSLAQRFVASIALTYAASVIAVFVSGRFRLPVVPSLFLAVGALLATFARAVKTHDFKRASPLAVAFVLAVFWTWPAKLKSSSSVESWFTLAQGFHRLKQLDEAERAYRAALHEQPTHLPSRHNLAVLYESRGEREAALMQWRSLLSTAENGSPEATRAARHIEKLSR
jgi:hypothetical protein